MKSYRKSRKSMFLTVFMFAAIVATASLNANAVVINFDDLQNGDPKTYLPEGYAGLNWDPMWFYWSWEQAHYNPSSPPTRIATHEYGGWIDFSPVGEPVIFEGAYFSGYSIATVYFEGYLEGELVGISSLLNLSSTPTFLAANFTGPVDYVNVICTEYNFFAMDDVTYIPEPATLLLLSLGAAIFLRRHDH